MFQPCFDWEEESKHFNAKIIPEITDDNREQVLALITTIGLEAHKITQNSLEETPTNTRSIIINICRHATNLLELDNQDDKARRYEDLALQFNIVLHDDTSENRPPSR